MGKKGLIFGRSWVKAVLRSQFRDSTADEDGADEDEKSPFDYVYDFDGGFLAFCVVFFMTLIVFDLFFSPLLVVTQIRGHIAGQVLLSLSHFYREKCSSLSFLVERLCD